MKFLLLIIAISSSSSWLPYSKKKVINTSLKTNKQVFQDSVGMIYSFIDSLSLDETKIFSSLKAIDKDFHYSNKVKRYIEVKNQAGWKVNILNEFIFEVGSNNLYHKEYPSYKMTFKATSWGFNIDYNFSAGKMHEGQGTISIFENNLLFASRKCGVSACSSEFYENGILVKSTFENVNRE